jgi:hypothetical protein
MNEVAGGTSLDICTNNSFTTSSAYLRQPGPFGGWASQWNGGVQCANENGFGNAEITVLCWVNLLATQQSRCFVDKWGHPTSINRGWALGIDDNANNIVKWYTAQASVSEDTILSTTVLNNGQWYQVVGTFDGATKRLFINGKQEATDSWAHTITYTSTTSGFGSLIAAGSATQQYNGLIDHCMVWNRALTAGEVMQLYQRPFTFIKPPPAAGALELFRTLGSLPLLGVGA